LYNYAKKKYAVFYKYKNKKECFIQLSKLTTFEDAKRIKFEESLDKDNNRTFAIFKKVL
jgi:hypothetical protein